MELQEVAKLVWTGKGVLGHVGAAGRLGERRTVMDEGTVVLLDGNGWGHAGTADREIGAG